MVSDAIQFRPEPIKDSMEDAIEQIRIALLAEYDLVGSVDVAAWVARFPTYRDEIIDYWLWVRGTPRSTEMMSGPFTAMDPDVAENAFKDACLAVNLGRQWLEAPLDPSLAAVREMGLALEALRAKPRATGGKAPVQFRKAVVWTWVVSVLQTQRARVSRLAVQKVTYILDCAMDLGIFTEHGRKPLGPYDYKARYKDAEPIAVKKAWLKVRGATFLAAEDLSEVRRFVGRYLRSQDLAERLINYLGNLPDEELETLATVYWSSKELVEAGRPMSAEEVREVLARIDEWRTKLDRPNFSIARVSLALQRLKELRLIPQR
jgi:hypothetical protein